MKGTLKLGAEYQLFDADRDTMLSRWVNGTQAIDSFCFDFGITFQTFWETFENHKGSRASAKIMLPWFVKEVTPDSRRPQVYRFGLETSDLSGNVMALLEAQALSVLAHWEEPITSIKIETSDAHQSTSWFQLWANVLGVPIHCGEEQRVYCSDLLLHQRYKDLKDVVLACEAHVLSNGPSPDRLRTSFSQRWR